MESKPDDIPTLRIGKVAKFAGCSNGTVLNYERQGLIKPALRNRAGHRMFTPAQAIMVREIWNMRKPAGEVK